MSTTTPVSDPRHRREHGGERSLEYESRDAPRYAVYRAMSELKTEYHGARTTVTTRFLMKVEARDGTRERTLVIALITDRRVLGRISSRWHPSLFSSRWASLVGDWCVQYFRQYGEPPQRAVQSLFSAWAETREGQGDKDTCTLVERFLSSLSDEYEETPTLNSEHLLDVAGSHFTRVRLERLQCHLEGLLGTGDVEGAEKAVHDYRHVELGTGARVDLLNDPEHLFSVVARQEEIDKVVSFPGALGKFLGRAAEPDNFIVIQGSSKSSKSFWLLEFAFRALCARKRVAYFEAGDLSQKQLIARFVTKLAQHPLQSPTGDWPYTVRIPEKLIPPPKGEVVPKVEFIERVFTAPLDAAGIERAREHFIQRTLRSYKPYLQISVHSNQSLSVDHIREVLEEWSLEDGWHPDIICVDYVDILLHDQSKKDLRDQINDTFMKLRALNQDTHTLLVTPSQADADSYEKVLQTRKNFSNDRRKNDHVTGTIAINMTAAEKEQGTCRLNWTVPHRDMDYSSEQVVYVGGSLALASPAMISSW